ncbi:MAG: hypothetical protein ABIR03_05110, partial [Ginsengibacter sp.]
MSIQKIIIKGSKQTSVIDKVEDDYLDLKESYQVGSQVRGIADAHEVSLENGEILQLKFDDDTCWFCNADTLEDIFPEAIALKRGAENDTFTIPSGINNTDAQRGIVGDILLKALNVFAKKKITREIGELAADLEKKQLDNLSGLYLLDKNFKLEPFEIKASTKPWLIFLHGTNSSAYGSFGELMQTDIWNYLHQEYAGQVLAFQHETLTKSPLQNVLEL